MSTPRESKTQRVAAYFQAHPLEWIDGDALRPFGGKYAYRTRISNCRKRLGMRIDNRQRTVKLATSTYVVSEYCYFPPAVNQVASEDWSLTG